MPPKTRKLILALMAAVFLVVGPLVVLYALGWRFNLAELRVEKTGGLLLKIYPTASTIKLDGQPIKTAADEKEILIDALAPKIYTVDISAAGYRPRQKKIAVNSSLVTEAEIVLLPDRQPTPLLNLPIHNFIFNERQQQLIWQDGEGDYFLTYLDQLESAFNLTKLFNYLKQTELNFPGFVPITEITAENSSIFIIKTAKAAYRLDIKKLKIELLGYNDDNDYANGDNNDEKIISKYSKYRNTGYTFALQNGNLHLLEASEKPSVANLVAAKVKNFAYDSEQARLYVLINRQLGYLNF